MPKSVPKGTRYGWTCLSISRTMLIPAAFLATGCLETTQPPTSVKPTGETFPTDLVRAGTAKSGYYDGQPIHYVEDNGNAYFEGDIILDKTRLSDSPPAGPLAKASALAQLGEAYRWPQGLIPFVIDADVPDHSRIYNAIAYWEPNTSIRFIQPVPGSGSTYIRFRRGSSCSSYAGRNPNIIEQFVEVGDNCSVSNMIHEIGHVIGFYHEHSRPDRGQYLNILWDNIQPGNCTDQFAAVYGKSFMNKFDFNSIMIYASVNGCSIDGRPTMTKKDGSPFSKSGIPSQSDYLAVKRMYPLYDHQGPTTGRDIGVGSEGSAYMVSNTPAAGGNYTLLKRHGYNWVAFPGSGVRLDVDPNGRPWTVMADGSVQRWTGSTWVTAANASMGAKDIGIGPSGHTWILAGTSSGGDRAAYRWGGGTSWTLVTGTIGTTMVEKIGSRISVDLWGRPWVISQGQSSTILFLESGKWQSGSSNTSYIDLGVGADNSVYGITDFALYRKAGGALDTGIDYGRSCFAMAGPPFSTYNTTRYTAIDGGPSSTFWSIMDSHSQIGFN